MLAARVIREGERMLFCPFRACALNEVGHRGVVHRKAIVNYMLLLAQYVPDISLALMGWGRGSDTILVLSKARPRVS